VPDSRTAALLGDSGRQLRRSGVLRWKLAQVIAVANDAPGLTDRELRDRLLALAESGTRCPRPAGLSRRWILTWRRTRRSVGYGGYVPHKTVGVGDSSRGWSLARPSMAWRLLAKAQSQRSCPGSPWSFDQYRRIDVEIG
jgi:hypothetical protein